MNKAEPTGGEVFVATLLSTAAALPAAIAGAAAAMFLCFRFLEGEMSQWALILAPAAALAFGTVAFVVVFRKVIRSGGEQ